MPARNSRLKPPPFCPSPSGLQQERSCPGHRPGKLWPTARPDRVQRAWSSGRQDGYRSSVPIRLQATSLFAASGHRMEHRFCARRSWPGERSTGTSPARAAVRSWQSQRQGPRWRGWRPVPHEVAGRSGVGASGRWVERVDHRHDPHRGPRGRGSGNRGTDVLLGRATFDPPGHDEIGTCPRTQYRGGADGQRERHPLQLRRLRIRFARPGAGSWWGGRPAVSATS